MAKVIARRGKNTQAVGEASAQLMDAEIASFQTVVPTVNVEFVLLDLGAKQVSLSGDFNGWASNATPMKWHPGGHWETTLALRPGRYEYKFWVDGEWVPDPFAQEHVSNQFGTLNSVVEVRS